MYGGVLISMAVVGTLVFANFQQPAQSQSSSPAFTAGASLPFYPVAIGGRIGHGWFPSKGKRGSFTIGRAGARPGTLPIKRIPRWRFAGFDCPGPPLLAPTGQYAQITGGGRRIVAGGHQATSYTRLFGRVSRPGGAKQRVIIAFKGAPNGVFVVRPLEPGVLKRDSGTQYSFGTG